MSRILIVEDDHDIADLVARYLTKAGYSAETVASGADAITVLHDRPPDLLLLDVMLPHVDGLEICRIVRSDPMTARMPIIMLTVRGEESERIAGLEAGAKRVD